MMNWQEICSYDPGQIYDIVLDFKAEAVAVKLILKPTLKHNLQFIGLRENMVIKEKLCDTFNRLGVQLWRLPARLTQSNV